MDFERKGFPRWCGAAIGFFEVKKLKKMKGGG